MQRTFERGHLGEFLYGPECRQRLLGLDFVSLPYCLVYITFPGYSNESIVWTGQKGL